MEVLKPLFMEQQIEHCLSGVPQEQQDRIDDKAKFVKDNISRILKVNGMKVYDPIVGDNDICYNLQETPDVFKKSLGNNRMYYYPIQYAEISFS